MRVVTAAVVLAFLCGPAFGQAQAVPQYGDMGKDKSIRQIQEEKDAEAAYRRSLGNIPEQKSNDPWGAVRGDNSAKPADKSADKPAARKAKTGSSATKTGTSAN
jgi:hypothetical protein